MNSRFGTVGATGRSPLRYCIGLLLMLVIGQACVAPLAPSSSSTAVDRRSSQPTQQPPATVQLSVQETPSATDALDQAMVDAPTPSPTLAVVTVTAIDGDLAIRAGPDVVFDAIAVLHAGETALALARSLLEGWVQISIPGRPGETGWVSIQTRFSAVNGEVLNLPKIMTVEWPIGSYLRNCTSHRLVVQPGDKVLAPVNESPDNRAWFFPGLYRIYDLDLPGRPEVTGIQLGEHTEVDIVEDGANQRGACD